VGVARIAAARREGAGLARGRAAAAGTAIALQQVDPSA
jgi:hypothetical protein